MLESLFAQFDSIVVLDTETTGFSPRSDEVIELALLRVTAAGEAEEYDEFIRLSPGKRLPDKITDLTGITEEMLRGGVGKNEAARALADMLGHGRTLVAGSERHQEGEDGQDMLHTDHRFCKNTEISVYLQR